MAVSSLVTRSLETARKHLHRRALPFFAKNAGHRLVNIDDGTTGLDSSSPTTFPLFALYTLGDMPHASCLPFPPFTCGDDGTFRFMASESGGGVTLSADVPIVELTIVPEPNTALLVGLGIVILGVRGRRRSA